MFGSFLFLAMAFNLQMIAWGCSQVIEALRVVEHPQLAPGDGLHVLGQPAQELAAPCVTFPESVESVSPGPRPVPSSMLPVMTWRRALLLVVLSNSIFFLKGCGANQTMLVSTGFF